MRYPKFSLRATGPTRTMKFTNDQARTVGVMVDELSGMYEELCRNLHDVGTCREIWQRIDERNRRIERIVSGTHSGNPT